MATLFSWNFLGLIFLRMYFCLTCLFFGKFHFLSRTSGTCCPKLCGTRVARMAHVTFSGYFFSIKKYKVSQELWVHLQYSYLWSWWCWSLKHGSKNNIQMGIFKFCINFFRNFINFWSFAGLYSILPQIIALLFIFALYCFTYYFTKHLVNCQIALWATNNTFSCWKVISGNNADNIMLTIVNNKFIRK